LYRTGVADFIASFIDRMTGPSHTITKILPEILVGKKNVHGAVLYREIAGQQINDALVAHIKECSIVPGGIRNVLL
jgi:hypothetical protein